MGSHRHRKRAKGTLTALILAIALPFAAVANEADFHGIVTRVFDGDSFLVRADTARKEIDVRLHGIDAPEKNQPYGHQARSALEKLIGGRRVFVDVIETDQYGRKIARVYREPDKLEIARALVSDGHVWVYRKYDRDRSLRKLEDVARSKGLGLWSLPPEDRMPPWQFRYLQRQQKRRAQSALEPLAPSAFASLSH